MIDVLIACFVVAMISKIAIFSFVHGHRLDFVKERIAIGVFKKHNIREAWEGIEDVKKNPHITHEQAVNRVEGFYAEYGHMSKLLMMLNCEYCLATFTSVIVALFRWGSIELYLIFHVCLYMSITYFILMVINKFFD